MGYTIKSNDDSCEFLSNRNKDEHSHIIFGSQRKAVSSLTAKTTATTAATEAISGAAATTEATKIWRYCYAC